MMRRVRHNIVLLIPRLRKHAYRFALQEPLTPPVDQVEGYLAVMEEWGPLPADLLPNFDRWIEAREDEEPSVDLDVCYDPAGVLGAFTLPGPSQPVDEPLEMEVGYTLPGPYGGQMLFVEYLRISLHWGGFPSLAYPHRSDVHERDVAPLVEGFLLF